MQRAGTDVMAWGVDDCALWVGGILHEALGYDAAKEIRGRYKTQRGAARVLGRDGLLGLTRKLARRHRWKRIAPQLAQAGDVGLVWTIYNDTPVLSAVVCRKNGWFVGRNDRGWTTIPHENIAYAWSVLQDNVSGSNVNMRRVLSRPDLCPTSAAMHEPISTAIELTALIEAIGASSAAAGAIGGFIVSATLSVGFSLAASLLQPHTGQGTDTGLGASSQAAAQITERQALPYKRVIVGSAYVGGALSFEQVKPPFLYQQILINEGQISGIDRITIGTNVLSFNKIVPDTLLVPLPTAGQPAYNTRLTASLRYGTDTQDVDKLLEADFPQLGLGGITSGPLTKIGNMTAGGNLAASFDGNAAQVGTASSSLAGTGSLTGTVGLNLGSAKVVNVFRIVAPTDKGFSASVDPTVIIKLQGSTDNFSSSIVDLYVESATAWPVDASLTRAFNNTTAYQYYRAQIIEQAGDAGSHSIYCCELVIYSTDQRQFRQRGIATATMRYHFGVDQAEYTNLWGQVGRPNAYFETRGVPVYDPRDNTQLLTDPTTWKWSNNASLVQAWYLTQPFGGRVAVADVLWAKVADSANYDDELVGCADGTFIKRHTIDGVITLNEKPYTVFPRLLSANRGLLMRDGGKWWVSSSRPKTAIATIHDKILCGGIKYQAAKAKRDQINKLQVRFVATEQNYQVIDGPILSRTDLQTTDGEILPGTLTLDFTRDYRRAERLQKAYMDSSRVGATLQCSVDSALLADCDDYIIGSCVNFYSDLWSVANGTYLVVSVGMSDDCSTMSLALVRYDPTIETNWHPEVDERAFSLTNPLTDVL